MILDLQDAILAVKELAARIRAGSDKAVRGESDPLLDLAIGLEDEAGTAAAALDRLMFERSTGREAA